MKTYVQDAVTLRFLCVDGTWSDDSQTARDFKSSAEAILFCCHRPDAAYQVLLKFGDPQYDILIPTKRRRRAFVKRPRRRGEVRI